MKIPTSNVTIWQNIKSLLRSTTIHSECDLLIWQSQKLKIRLLANCPALSLLCPQTDVDVDADDEEEYRTNYPRHVLLSQPIKAFLPLVPSGAQLIKSSLHSSAISSLQSGLNQCQLDCDWMEQPNIGNLKQNTRKEVHASFVISKISIIGLLRSIL